MNRHTFGDATKGKKNSIDIELAMNNDASDDDGEVVASRERIEGEVDADPDEKFNEVGEVIEPFHMKRERDHGTIDESGSYHFAKEEGIRDAWLANIDEAAMEREIGDAQEGLRRRRAMEEEKEKTEAHKVKKSSMQLKLELIDLMEPRETVADSMRRYGNVNRLHQFKGRNKEASSEVQIDKQKSIESRRKIEKLTELASQLMSDDKTFTGIYEMTRESIEASTVSWEYRGHDGVIQGPFSSLEISEWKKAGYFTGPTAVMMRKIDAEVMAKRKLDADRRKEQDMKRMRTEEPQTHKSIADELADDLEDEDSDDGLTIAEIMAKDRARKEKANQQQGGENRNSIGEDNNDNGVIEDEGGVWISSDDIDFGEYVKFAEVGDDSESDNADTDDGEE